MIFDLAPGGIHVIPRLNNLAWQLFKPGFGFLAMGCKAEFPILEFLMELGVLRKGTGCHGSLLLLFQTISIWRVIMSSICNEKAILGHSL